MTPHKRRGTKTILGGFFSIIVIALVIYYAYLIDDSPLKTNETKNDTNQLVTVVDSTNTTNTTTVDDVHVQNDVVTTVETDNSTGSNSTTQISVNKTFHVKHEKLYKEREFDNEVHYVAAGTYGVDWGFQFSKGYWPNSTFIEPSIRNRTDYGTLNYFYQGFNWCNADPSYFSYYDTATLNHRFTGNSFCAMDKSFYLQGTLTSPNQSYFQILLGK